MSNLEDKKALIIKFLNCFEQGAPQFRHDKVDLLPDQVFPGSSDRVKGVTISYGLTQNSHLFEFLTDYVALKSKYSDAFRPYLPKIKQRSLAGDSNFISLLRKAAREDTNYTNLLEGYFDIYYYSKGLSWFLKNGFITPLGLACCQDSFLNSGSVLDFLRKRFPASPKDGDKVFWTQYMTARKNWLKNHSDPVLRALWTRPQFYLDLINEGDWDLSKKTYYPNGVKVTV
jgi:chitosanase